MCHQGVCHAQIHGQCKSDLVGVRRAWLRHHSHDHVDLPDPGARLRGLCDVGRRERHEIREWRANAELDRTGAGSGRYLPDDESPEPHPVVKPPALTAFRPASGGGTHGFGVEGASLRETANMLNRRNFLAATAGSIATGALPAFAAAPYTLNHGAFAVTIVSDGHLVLPTSFLAPDAPAAEREPLLRAAGQTEEQYNSPTNVTLIASGQDLILVDMGSGDRFMPTAGKLWQNLKAASIDKGKITKVIFTHGHPDHLWGTVDELDELVTPDAAYFVAAHEWNFWTGDNATRGLPAERAGFVTGARRNYAAIKDKVKMVKPGDDIVTGLRLIDTPGHTQGHVSLELAGAGGLIVGGDVLTHPLISFAHPEWRPTADHVPEQAAETRRKLLDRLATDRAKLIGFHLPYPGVGTVERNGLAYRFVSVA